jgi:hypothetical protein
MDFSTLVLISVTMAMSGMQLTNVSATPIPQIPQVYYPVNRPVYPPGAFPPGAYPVNQVVPINNVGVSGFSNFASSFLSYPCTLDLSGCSHFPYWRFLCSHMVPGQSTQSPRAPSPADL